MSNHSKNFSAFFKLKFDILIRYVSILGVCGFLVPLIACDFHPIYGSPLANEETVVATELNTIAIEGIPDRTGQLLRNDLIDQMYRKGRPPKPLYTLSVHVHSTEEDLGIQADATSTRSLLNMYADFTLKDLNEKIMLKGSAHSVASFNTLTQQYGTQSAREGATERTLNEVSNQIVNRLSLYFSEKDEVKPEAKPD